jgi:glycosyltransferase involved in cell wall biosynthesis
VHVLFVHQNFPAQFGHVARELARRPGWRCTFASTRPPGESDGVRRLQYRPAGGARASTHFCSRTFENATWHAHAVYEACKAEPDLRPDLIVGHSGFGSTLFLPELYPDAPVVNYFEFYYHRHGSDLDFRPEFPPSELTRLRARSRNAMVLLDLVNCAAGYSPTHYQRDLLPAELRHKVRVIFDGVDTRLYHPRPGLPRRIAGRDISPQTRIVTYVSRGFEALRGFDVFMRAAKRVYLAHPDVLFVCVGGDRVWYGDDLDHIKHPTFREHVLARDDYDLTKFLFTGIVPHAELARLLALSDLHIYLTAPFVLSWSLMDALACGCTVLASDTPPVREVIEDGRTGLLAGFFDDAALAERALAVLREPSAFRHLGEAAAALVRDRYALARTLPELTRFLEEVRAAGPA